MCGCMRVLLAFSWEEGPWLSTDSQRNHDPPKVKYSRLTEFLVIGLCGKVKEEAGEF